MDVLKPLFHLAFWDVSVLLLFVEEFIQNISSTQLDK